MDDGGTITGDDVGHAGRPTPAARPIVIDNCGTDPRRLVAIHTSGGDDIVNTSGLIFSGINAGARNDTIFVTGRAISGSIDGGRADTLNFASPMT